jgi:hypothetical protein
MENINLLFEHIIEKKFIKIRDKTAKIYIKTTGEEFNSRSLVEIAEKLKYLLLNYRFFPLKVEVNLGEVVFTDKPTYLVLDALLYYVLKKSAFKIRVVIEADANRVMHNGLGLTAFIRHSDIYGVIDKKGFLNAYKKKLHIDYRYFRAFMNRQEMESVSAVSFLMSDVASFLKPFSKDCDSIDLISEIVAELVDNVKCHSDGDCIIDIDIVELVKSSNSQDYLCVNVTIFNLSHYKLGDRVKENILKELYPKDDPLYSQVYLAFDNHKKFFDSNYEIDDFFNITTFQKHVSSRTLTSGTGGTGLTNLIEQIIGNSEEQYTYVISGTNVIFFKQDCLSVTEDGFVGFNLEGDFINKRPDSKVLDQSFFYFPGTLYHLSFVL